MTASLEEFSDLQVQKSQTHLTLLGLDCNLQDRNFDGYVDEAAIVAASHPLSQSTISKKSVLKMKDHSLHAFAPPARVPTSFDSSYDVILSTLMDFLVLYLGNLLLNLQKGDSNITVHVDLNEIVLMN